jgi:hypothetical protein
VKHTENVARVIEARTVETGKYYTIEVDYVTAGGVTKCMRLAHGDADWFRVLLINEFDYMEPEKRKRSFFASLRRKR